MPDPVVTPPPAAATPPPPTAVAPPVTPPSTSGGEWTTGLDADMLNYVNGKGFKTPHDVLNSYRNFEKLRGAPAERILTLPENLDSPEARAVWERLGAPKEAKDYNLEVPKDYGDQKLADWAAGEFHKLGVPKNMAQNFIKAWNQKAADTIKSMTAARTAAATTAEANLKTEWGVAYDKNKNIVEQAASTLGLSKEQLQTIHQTLGPEGAPKLLLKLGAATQEHSFVSGKGAGQEALAPQAAEARIHELMSNRDFTQRLQQGDQTALREWQKAHEMAMPGNMSFT